MADFAPVPKDKVTNPLSLPAIRFAAPFLLLPNAPHFRTLDRRLEAIEEVRVRLAVAGRGSGEAWYSRTAEFDMEEGRSGAAAQMEEEGARYK